MQRGTKQISITLPAELKPRIAEWLYALGRDTDPETQALVIAQYRQVLSTSEHETEDIEAENIKA